MNIDIELARKTSLGEVNANAYGLLSWTSDPYQAGNATAPTSQKGYFAQVPLRAGMTVSNIWIAVATAGAGTAPTTVKLALTDVAGASRLATTANIAGDAKLTAQGFKSFGLSSPYTIPSDGNYAVLLLQDGAWGSTNMTLGRSLGTAGGSGYGSLNSVFPYGTWGTGQTDIGTGPFTFALDATGVSYWFGVS